MLTLVAGWQAGFLLFMPAVFLFPSAAPQAKVPTHPNVRRSHTLQNPSVSAVTSWSVRWVCKESERRVTDKSNGFLATAAVVWRELLTCTLGQCTKGIVGRFHGVYLEIIFFRNYSHRLNRSAKFFFSRWDEGNGKGM